MNLLVRLLKVFKRNQKHRCEWIKSIINEGTNIQQKLAVCKSCKKRHLSRQYWKENQSNY